SPLQCAPSDWPHARFWDSAKKSATQNPCNHPPNTHDHLPRHATWLGADYPTMPARSLDQDGLNPPATQYLRPDGVASKQHLQTQTLRPWLRYAAEKGRPLAPRHWAHSAGHRHTAR